MRENELLIACCPRRTLALRAARADSPAYTVTLEPPMTMRSLAHRTATLFAFAVVIAAALPISAQAAPCTGSVYAHFVNRTSGPNPLYAVAGDFNGDGRLDLAVTNSDFPNGGSGSSLAIFLATGPRAYAAPGL